jgi:hypothetical protein
MTDRDEPLDEAHITRLRQQTDQVPPEVADRLAAMRRRAVAEWTPEGPPRRLWPGGATWAAAAATVLIAVALLARLNLGGVDQARPAPLLLADADELQAVAELDVLEELEFLAWLDEGPLDAG